MNAKTARWVNVMAGFWLSVSALVWPHSGSQYANTWIMGIIAIAVALIALAAPGFRYVNTVVGAWLVVSAFALPTISTATRWNNSVVGVVIGGLSLIGASSGATPFRRLRAA